MKLISIGALLGGLVLLAGAVSAAPRLTGRVTDYAARAVYLADLDFYTPGTKTKIDVQPPGSPSQNEKTNFSGQYSLQVVAGEYDIRYQPPPGRADLASILLRNVSIPGDTAIDIVLPRGYPVSGFVRDSQGNPVSGVDIDVVDRVTGRRVPTPGDNSGGSGAYRVIVVPGLYTVHFSPPAGVRLAPASIEEVAVEGPTQLDVTLEPGFVLAGLVRDPEGRPLPGIDLDVDRTGDGARVRTVDDQTTPDGRYGLVVPAGTFDVTFNPPPGAPLAASVMRGLAIAGDLELPEVRLEPGVEIRARISGPPGVSLAGARSLFFEETSGWRYPTPHGFADTHGQFGTIRVPAGVYHVRIALPEHLAIDTLDVGTHWFDRDVDVVWDIAAGPLLTLSIEARVEGSPAGASIHLWRSPRGAEAVAMAVTGPDGLAQLLIPAGTYDLLIRPESGLEPDSLLIEAMTLAADSNLVLEFRPRLDPPVAPFDHSPFSPNPFLGSTRLTVVKGAMSGLKVSVFDLTGRFIWKLELPGGNDASEVVWDGRDQAGRAVPAGVYVVRLDAPGRSASTRVVRLR